MILDNFELNENDLMDTAADQILNQDIEDELIADTELTSGTADVDDEIIDQVEGNESSDCDEDDSDDDEDLDGDEEEDDDDDSDDEDESDDDDDEDLDESFENFFKECTSSDESMDESIDFDKILEDIEKENK